MEVVRVDAGRAPASVEEVLGVGGQELVDRAGGADEEPRGSCRRAARRGPSAARCEAIVPGYPTHDRRVQPTDVDPQLQRVGRDHAAHPSVAQAALDLAPLVGQVAAPVAADRVRVAGRWRERLAQVGGQHLDRGARAAEDDRLHAAADEPLARCAAPVSSAELRMPSCSLATGGLTTSDVLAPARRAVVVDQLDRRLESAARPAHAGLAIVAVAKMNVRVRAVVPADAAQAAHHVGDVAAEQRRGTCAARRSPRTAGSRRA